MMEISKLGYVPPRKDSPDCKLSRRRQLKFTPELPTERLKDLQPLGWRRLSRYRYLSESAVTKLGGTAEGYLSSLL